MLAAQPSWFSINSAKHGLKGSSSSWAVSAQCQGIGWSASAQVAPRGSVRARARGQEQRSPLCDVVESQATRDDRKQADCRRSQRNPQDSPALLTQSIKGCASWQELQQLVAASSLQFNHIHVTAAATRAAALLGGPAAVPAPSKAPAADQAACSLNGSSATGASMHAAVGGGQNGTVRKAAAGMTPAVFAQQLAQLLEEHADMLDARGVANALWALARIASGVGQPPAGPLEAGGGTPMEAGPMQRAAVQLLGRACGMDFRGFLPQHLSNTLWACATLRLNLSASQAAALFVEAEQQLHSFNDQALSNMLWACAVMGLQPPASLMHKLYAMPPGQLQQLGPQAVSNTLWALATLCTGGDRTSVSSSNNRGSMPAPPAPWLRMLLSGAQPQLPSFNSQALSNTLWALAHLGHVPSPAFARALYSSTAQALPAMQPQHLSNVLWAVSKLTSPPAAAGAAGEVPTQGAFLATSPAWLDAAALRLGEQLQQLTDEGLTAGSLALAKLGWQPGGAWAHAWCAEVQARCAHMGPQALASCIAAASVWLAGSGQSSGSEAGVEGTVQVALLQLLEAACGELAGRAEGASTGAAHVGNSRRHAQHVQASALDLLTALSALAELGSSGWLHALTGPSSSSTGSRGSTEPHPQGLLLLVRASTRHMQLHGQQQWTAGQQAALCWALAHLSYQPPAAWRKAVLQPLLQQHQQQLGLGPGPQEVRRQRGSGPMLTGKEATMLLWACQRWGVQLVQGGKGPDQPAAAGEAAGEEQEADSPRAPDSSSVAMALVTLVKEWRRGQASNKWQGPAQSDEADGSSSRGWEEAGGQVGRQQRQQPGAALQQQATQLLRQAAAEAACMTPQDVSQCLWAAAALGFKPGRAWQAALLQRLVALLGTGAMSQELPMCMWSMAQLGIKPPRAALTAMLAACVGVGQAPDADAAAAPGLSSTASPGPALSVAQPQSLCHALEALATWEAKPSGAWWAALLALPGWGSALSGSSGSTGSTTAVAGWRARDLLHVGRCLASLQAPLPHAWVRAYQDRALQLAEEASQQAQAAGVPGTGHVSLLAVAIGMHAGPEPGASHSKQQQAGTSSEEAAWLERVLSACEDWLRSLPLRACAALLHALGSRRGDLDAGQLDGALTTFLIVSKNRLRGAAPRDVLSLLHGLAAVKARPSEEWSEAAAEALAAGMMAGTMGAEEVADVLPALSAARCSPGRRWLLAYLRAVSQLLGPAGARRAAAAAAASASQASLASASYDDGAGSSSSRRSSGADSGQEQGSDRPAAAPPRLSAAGPASGARGAAASAPAAPSGGQLLLLPDVQLEAHHVSAISSALLRLDPELGRQWMQQLVVVYGQS